MSDTIFNEGILKGRVAFVTGGGTGITGGVARALAEAGASVALVSRKLDHLQPAAQAINDNGGKVLNGPMEIPGGEFAVFGMDPQGASFGLVGPRKT